MRKIGLLLLTAPLGYALLTGYLVAKVRPAPITWLPAASADDRVPERLAA